MTDTTTGSDLYNCVEKCLNELKVDWKTFSSITTDGDPAMLDVKAGLVSRLKSKALTYGVELKSFHCIIHQESLCSKKLKMEHVMNIVIKTVNKLAAMSIIFDAQPFFLHCHTIIPVFHPCCHDIFFGILMICLYFLI